MAKQQFRPANVSSRASSAALLVAASCLAVPTLAATPHKILCSEADDPDLEVPVEALSVETVNHNLTTADIDETKPDDEAAAARTRIFEPRAKAAIREAFDEVEVVSEDANVEVEETDEEEIAPRIINTRLPGVTEERLERFKRQMYRRDI